MRGVQEQDAWTDCDADASTATAQAAELPQRKRPRHRLASKFITLDVSSGHKPPELTFTVRRVPVGDAEQMFCMATGVSPAQLGCLHGYGDLADAGARAGGEDDMATAIALAFGQQTRQYRLLLQELYVHQGRVRAATVRAWPPRVVVALRCRRHPLSAPPYPAARRLHRRRQSRSGLCGRC